MFQYLKDIWRLRTLGASRSPKWSTVRNQFIKDNPICAVCGKTKNLTVHHKKPFHLFPKEELNPKNLVTLCESRGMNCHITFGHLGNFQHFNETVDIDVLVWNRKLYTFAIKV